LALTRKPLAVKLFFPLALAASCLFAYSCHKPSPSSDENKKRPYPAVEVQRKALAAKPYVTPIRLLDSTVIIQDLQYLASDVCEGRKPGSPGHTRALERIAARLRAAEVDSFSNSLFQHFAGSTQVTGQNIIGWLKGTTYPDKFIVVSAHYDHLGKAANGAIYYGADDNASGVACLLALAHYYVQHRPLYSVIFAAFDQEETGLEGAYYYVEELRKANKLKTIKLNLNMDMIARSDKNEIFVCGLKRNTGLKYVVDNAQSKTNVCVLMGHDEGSRAKIGRMPVIIHHSTSGMFHFYI
jgi:hypothetical protein